MSLSASCEHGMPLRIGCDDCHIADLARRLRIVSEERDSARQALNHLLQERAGMVASATEHEQALDLLCGLHVYLTVDGPPMAVAERIFDAVMAERSELLEKIENGERNLEAMRQHLQKAKT